ncbi:protein of unknown function DUF4116 containing protein [Nitzschia inconspicua]|uniref:Uncharacterized protein n=1 Tax=Nitzschia inconspicua TaxID=303405 RepID=A0A9K3PZQ6_9STRA|nr:protein of unknown function DUF4116 containing protein [Nitzschia inconspicua]
MPESRKRTTSCGTSLASPVANVAGGEDPEDGNPSPPSAKKSKQELSCPETSTTNEKRRMISEEVFQTHLDVAKRFITSYFHSLDKEGPANGFSRVPVVWSWLNGTQWREDPDVVVAALKIGLKPLPYLRGNPILKDSGNLIEAFQATKYYWQAMQLWDLVEDPELKEYPPLVLVALERGVPKGEVNMEVVNDGETLLELIKDGTISWESLPENFKSDVEFALCARKCTTVESDCDSFSSPLPPHAISFPTVLKAVTDKERLWREWGCIHPEEAHIKGRLLWGEAPEQVMSDRRLMMEVIPIAAHVFEYISRSLKDDEAFLQELVKEKPVLLGVFSKDIFLMFPNFLTIEWIRDYWDEGGDQDLKQSYGMENKLQDCIPEQYWQDRDFVLNTWVAGGGPMNEHLHKSYYDDEEFLLTQAKCYYSHPLRHSVFDCCNDQLYPMRLSPRLKADKPFLRSLIELAFPEHMTRLFKPYRYGPDGLRIFQTYSDDSDDEVFCKPSPLHHDEELVILLFSKEHSTYCELMDFWWPTIKRKVEDYERFFRGILCGTHPRSGSSLSLLDQGKDSNIIKKTIASFLDFPIGKQFRELIQAKEHFGIDKELLFNGEDIPPEYIYVQTNPEFYNFDYYGNLWFQ